MTRIFSGLALFALVLLGANIVLGWSIGPLHEVATGYVAAQRTVLRLERSANPAADEVQQAREALQRAADTFRSVRSRYGGHTLLGIAAGLVTILVNSITVTYFVGTSRWCREVCEAYRLSSDFVARSQRLKRLAFPWALSGMLVVLAIAALGGASDPAANFYNAHHYVFWHGTAAVLGWLLIAVSFWVQLGYIASNYAVIEEILVEVQRAQQRAAGRRMEQPADPIRSPSRGD